MTEIKKGTPVWVWCEDPEQKERAVYQFYDDATKEGCLRHLVYLEDNDMIDWFTNAEPINETNDKAMQLIAEAKEKIAEAEKLLNAL